MLPSRRKRGQAVRELAEEAGISASTHLEQLRTYAAPGRDPRMRVASLAYVAMVPRVPQPMGGDDARDAQVFPVDKVLLERRPKLAFDHQTILADAVERMRSKLEYSSLATAFLKSPFTLSELREVYEIVWGVTLHAANFRRKVLSTEGFVFATAESRTPPTGGPAAQLYKPGTATLLHPAMLRPRIET